MIFKTIYLKEDNRERVIDFTQGNNLVFSKANSKGKTTLLRFLLYALGYNIPNTKYIRFENCRVELRVELDGNEITLIRDKREYIVLVTSVEEKTYILPSQEYALHTILFKTENIDLLNNILGTFYFDQEKGWTLLNRGVVIGKIRYNIEELIRGINNIDCSVLLQSKEQKSQDLLKFKQMYSVSKYKETLDKASNNLASEQYNTIIESKIDQCKIQQNILRDELLRIDKVLKDNQRFKAFISDIGLLISLPNGETIKVTEDNIVGLNDTIYYLVTKKKIIAINYNKVSAEIDKLEKERQVEDAQLSFFDDINTIADIFDKKISSIPINTQVVEKKIRSLEAEISEINREIKKLTQNANRTITNIYNNAKKYLNELGLDGDEITNKYLFTSNLKELSGAILHKTVFALRLACLIEIEKTIKMKLPIILDSPSGKEVDSQNIEKMINILNRDFLENQIIVASIFDYDLNNLNIIEIKNNLIE